jgi:DNA-binding NarL/FixJ family response regulator
MVTTGPAVPLRVVIGEDDVLLREGVARLLTDAGIVVVAQAGDARDLVSKTLAYRPDVAIVDVRMPPNANTTAWSPPSNCAVVCRRPPCSSFRSSTIRR